MIFLYSRFVVYFYINVPCSAKIVCYRDSAYARLIHLTMHSKLIDCYLFRKIPDTGYSRTKN
jgi:hypothetical protein